MRDSPRDKRPRIAGRASWALFLGAALLGQPIEGSAQDTFDRFRDRGPGVAVSMFGTYIEAGEFLLYPFFEYYRDKDAEYSPNDLGYGLDQDFRGTEIAREGLIWVGYGVSDRLALEFEVAVMSARLDKSPDDPSDMPDHIKESGLGDVEGQLRWRWAKETAGRPGIFSYFETVFPLKDKHSLIGTSAWEFQAGTGIVRAFPWGTTTLRVAVGYDGAENVAEFGEYAVEYLKRISPGLRVFAAVEGSEDEVELITEAQWFLRPNVFLKLNNAFGVTSKATDWAPEVGIMISFR